MCSTSRLVRLAIVLVLAVLCQCYRAAGAQGQAGGLSARHEAGQTLLTFVEVDSPVAHGDVSMAELRKLLRERDDRKKVRYRIYRSDSPITFIEGRKPIAEVPPLTCWNADYYGVSPKPEDKAFRFVVEEGKGEVPPGTGIYACNPKSAGDAYYAVTMVVDGQENGAIGASNSLRTPVHEEIGLGVPVLQRVEKPESFNYVENPTLYYYTRWESPPNCAVQGKPFDYVVAVPRNLAKPAPVGIHLHCWGDSLNSGYGWWYQGEDGHILIASNQVPYDWWTGYHELYWNGEQDEQAWKQGVVRPYSQTRVFSFLDWVATKWDVDLTRTHVAGSSMGGSGSPMLAVRYPERIAWCVSWVGVHDPGNTPGFKGSYERVYGKQAWDVKFEDGNSVWDHFNDPWYLRQHVKKDIGLICFSNGKNDSGIGWPQAVAFYRALQQTRQPHVFVWGQSGHGQRAALPRSLGDRVMPLDLRTDQSQPAFTNCSLDDNPGNGDPDDGDAKGQVNLYLHWETEDIVDQPERWEMTVGLVDRAPKDECTVTITPRRLQAFRPDSGRRLRWTNTSIADNREVQTGFAIVDPYGRITLLAVQVTKGQNRICLWQ